MNRHAFGVVRTIRIAHPNSLPGANTLAECCGLFYKSQLDRAPISIIIPNVGEKNTGTALTAGSNTQIFNIGWMKPGDTDLLHLPARLVRDKEGTAIPGIIDVIHPSRIF